MKSEVATGGVVYLSYQSATIFPLLPPPLKQPSRLGVCFSDVCPQHMFPLWVWEYFTSNIQSFHGSERLNIHKNPVSALPNRPRGLLTCRTNKSCQTEVLASIGDSLKKYIINNNEEGNFKNKNRWKNQWLPKMRYVLTYTAKRLLTFSPEEVSKSTYYLSRLGNPDWILRYKPGKRIRAKGTGSFAAA